MDDQDDVIVVFAVSDINGRPTPVAWAESADEVEAHSDALEREADRNPFIDEHMQNDGTPHISEYVE